MDLKKKLEIYKLSSKPEIRFRKKASLKEAIKKKNNSNKGFIKK